MDLYKLQKNFANHIVDEKNRDVFSQIVGNNQNLTKKRLNIYRNNVFGSFEDSLSLTYAIVKKIVGDDYFFHLTRKYQENYKSNSGNLEDYGEYFSKLLKDNENEHKLLYLSDIAILEWYYNLAYLSKDVKPIDLKTLQNIDGEVFMDLYFQLHPSCYLMASQYPIFSIYRINNNDTEEKINIAQKEGEYILIERSLSQVNVNNLSKIEYNFLKMTAGGMNVYEIFNNISQYTDNFDIGSWVNKYISLGIISNFSIKNDYKSNKKTL